MQQRTQQLERGRRPSLGVMVFDDGSTYALDADYLIGREPETAPGLRPLRLADEERTLSRKHASVRREGWDVVVLDEGSANGTFVLPSGATEWQRVEPGTQVVLDPGARVALGQRSFLFESHHVR
jgi:pSer/pThr/pTyr-binding forkhead associated (FHA) protein